MLDNSTVLPTNSFFSKGNKSNFVKEKHVRLHLSTAIKVNFISTGTN